MTVRESLNNATNDELAEFIHLNICNSCHFCIYFKSKKCKINVNCVEEIKEHLKKEI